ncbi:MAG TPA: EAL domain-containing protein [Noviherbaspirillum sp.]|jgi:diguanylate cyclase (GGDEF)-like protein/PAS domain S-box-containing protein|uniref:bifunctional diguanylate cyclase/phosphodiesterase n=1 Tax=Noviherbaspirillum sp. TaxID=1926288 RepID=UPI002F956E93
MSATDEDLRLEALGRFQVLDTGPEPQFDAITALAAAICEAPMAVITLIDERRQWFKSKVGVDVIETPREIAFCNHTIGGPDLFVVADAAADTRFARNPLVEGPPRIRFYAGMPLLTADGHAVGSLAVMDVRPRTLTPLQQQALRVFGRQVMTELELRKSLREQACTLVERDRAQKLLLSSHRQLEQIVHERTLDLKDANVALQMRCDERAREAAAAQAIVDSLPGIFYVIGADRRFLRWNRNLEKVLGCSADDLRNAHAEQFFAPPDRQLILERMARVLEAGSAESEASIVTRDGRAIPYFLSGLRIEIDGLPCVAGMGIDISRRRKAEETLRLRDRAIQASTNAIIITDLDGNIEHVNPAFERITGYRAEEAIGRNCRFLQDDDRQQPGVDVLRTAIQRREEGGALLRNYRRDGQLFWNDVHIAPVRTHTGEVSHFVGVLNDITSLKRYEEQLERQANFDPLTALANRSVLKDRIKQALATAARHRELVAVGFIDLDNFKFINDSLGHNVGDELLKQVASRLAGCIREQDTVARYGGDEFAFVLLGQHDDAGITQLMERILSIIGKPFSVSGHEFFISCSIGISFFPRDGHDADTLLRNADAAMYRAKESGRNNFQFYTPAMNERMSQRLSLESRLRQAIDRNEFSLQYQPKVDLMTGAVVGAEALLRWHRPDGKVVGPSTFIPVAEETGMIGSIGDWALNQACRDIMALQATGMPPIRVAVNISARQFNDGGIVAQVRAALHGSGLAPECLELELTESLVMQNPEEAARVLHELKDIGVHLAIDDFGTGYSSLSYLQRFPVDHLKIDQSFVRDIGADPNDAIIARAVISLGHSLGMQVIAEGVSSEVQLAFLRANGCDQMQGFLFSRPLAIGALSGLVAENRARNVRR